jgi:hypothetical protein
MEAFMASWLYQMTSNDEEPWSPNEYRMEVWEGMPITWPVGKVIYRDQPRVARGDTVVFFFTKTRNEQPGFYGWGIVLEVVESKARNRIKFQVCPPSDFLKIAVVWDNQLEKLVDKVRGPMAQATMWALKDDEFALIKRKFVAR